MSKNIIEVNGLTKEYGERKVVDDVSFSVERGEIFAFLGPNWAGKSTTIRMLTTLLDPTSGNVRIDGNDPMANARDVRKSFGIVFQDPSLDEELTAYENMYLHAALYGIARSERRKKIEELLAFVELLERKNDLVKDFSGWMKRRLEIARGLLHHPKIIFLDEPTLGLDPQTRNHMWSYIENLNRTEGITVFFTTHYMDEAERIAQKIAIIDHGKIIALGSPEELRKQTDTDSLEDAFLALTGKSIREQEWTWTDRMRMFRASRSWR